MKQRWLKYGLMLLLGVCHAQTFSNWASGFLQIFLLGLAWLIVATAQTSDKPARQMFVFAWGGFTAGLYWLHFSMHDIGGLPTWMSAFAIAALSAYLALYPTLAAWVWRQYFSGSKISDYLVAIPLLWLLAELLRGYLFGGFPWLMTGYVHVDTLWLKGWFALTGAYGVAAWAAFASGLVAFLGVKLIKSKGSDSIDFKRTPSSKLLPAKNQWSLTPLILVALIVIGWILQGINWAHPTQTISIKVVQPNVAQSIKFDRDEIFKNTLHTFNIANNSTAQLTVFPETVMPYPWNQVPGKDLLHVRNALQASPRAVLLGGVGVQGDVYYNSALWLDNKSDVFNPPRYDKIHLLPFGEMIPFGFQWFVKTMNIPLGGYGYGQSRAPFVLNNKVRIGTNICYENVFGEELAAWHKDDALAPNIWVNLTNLGWFGDARTSPAHGQFLDMSRARAMELARPMITVTNTGISAYITPDGNVAQRLPAQAATVGDWQVTAYEGTTPFAIWGNAPLWGGLMVFGAATAWMRKKNKDVIS